MRPHRGLPRTPCSPCFPAHNSSLTNPATTRRRQPKPAVLAPTDTKRHTLEPPARQLPGPVNHAGPRNRTPYNRRCGLRLPQTGNPDDRPLCTNPTSRNPGEPTAAGARAPTRAPALTHQENDMTPPLPRPAQSPARRIHRLHHQRAARAHPRHRQASPPDSPA